MIVDAWVTRPEVGGGNLDLVSSTYKIEGEEGIDFGDRTWRRNMVTSPFVHGEFPVTQALNNSMMPLSLQVRSTSQSGLSTAIATLVAAFSQFEYELHVQFDDVERAWLCYAADLRVGTHDERFAQWNVNVKLTIPRSPIPVGAGGI